MASRTLAGGPLVSMDAPAMESEKRYFAYRLGQMSRSNIHREVGRAEPRLHKLIGHCSLFDNARRFIIEQINSDHHDADDEDGNGNGSGESWLDNDASAAGDKDGVSFQYVEDVQMQRRLQADQPVVVVTATQIATGDYDDSDDDDDDDLEWDGDSDSTTGAREDDEEDCSDDDSEWSDSTWDEDGDSAPPHVYAPAASAGQKHHCRHRDDDLLLWSQQPHVMSQWQADHLLIEAIG